MVDLRILFPNLTDEQMGQCSKLEALYVDWNAKINVISRKDMDAFYIHHVLHSLALAKVVQFEPGTKVLDVGTGGGFPGIPLAIFFPDTTFHLIDSIGKKVMVVKSVIEALGLKNVQAKKCRAEELDGGYEYIVSRAVARLGIYYGWVEDLILNTDVRGAGLYFLKGGDLTDEIKEFRKMFPKKKVRTSHISSFFDNAYFETKKVLYIKSSS